MRAVDDGTLDALDIPSGPLDVLAQQIVAASAEGHWHLDDLYALCTRSFVYQGLERPQFDELIEMLTHGFATERGRRGIMLHRDAAAGTMFCLVRPRTAPKEIVTGPSVARWIGFRWAGRSTFSATISSSNTSQMCFSNKSWQI